jgi:hypothetical protein
VTWSVAPSGGTLTASGLTATFTATTAGSYAVSATSASDPTKSGTVAVTVMAPRGRVRRGKWNGDDALGQRHRGREMGGRRLHSPGAEQFHDQRQRGTDDSTVRDRRAGAGCDDQRRRHSVSWPPASSSTRFVTFRRNNASQAWERCAA